MLVLIYKNNLDHLLRKLNLYSIKLLLLSYWQIVFLRQFYVLFIFMATFPKFTSRYFFFYLPILLSLMVFSLFHSVGYKNHSVGYIFHTVKYKSHTVKQRIFQFI